MSQRTLPKIGSSAGQAQQSPKTKRRDIQGLRAIAVTAVIADHLLHWPSGGFAGVDVFFVISGFLITGLLLREYDRTGSVSFMGFYRRRVRRIMPAAVVVLTVTSALCLVLFNAGRAQQTVEDALWSFLFSANWHFAAAGTDYFQGAGPVSPLQHFWSLAVEEQFYFIWPGLMLLIFWVGGRTVGWDRWKARRAVAVAMLLIVVLSFGWAVVESVGSPTVAYFSTLTRAWELGAGALLAVCAPAFGRIPAKLRPVLGWAGVAGIFWSLLTISNAMPFPGPGAAMPVLATAIVIAAGTGGELQIWPLTNRMSGYLGDISYSMYLWHFPAIIFLAPFFREGSPLFIAAALSVTLVLAATSFHFVEERVLKSNWLGGPGAAKSTRRDSRRTRDKQTRRTQLITVGALAVLGMGASAYGVMSHSTSGTEPLVQGSATTSSLEAGMTLEAARADAVERALVAVSWPKLTPELGELKAKGYNHISCHVGPDEANPSDTDVFDTCVNGDKSAKRTAFLLGDSYAASLSPGVIAALVPEGYKVVVLARSSCPAVDVDVKLGDGSEYPQCAAFQDFVRLQVARHAPDLVIVSSWHGHVINRLVSGATGADAIGEWKTALANSVKEFAASAKRVAVVSGTPSGRNLQECATPISRPEDCVAPVPDEYRAFASAEQSVVESLGSRSISYVPVQDWFCASGKCPPFIGKNPVYVDGGHLTASASEAAAPLLRASLLRPEAEGS
jgi:peptidoglycan/LPS O-acetylase OafA/YrhL